MYDDHPGKALRMSINDYLEDLENLIQYSNETFETNEEDQLEEFDENKKIKTSWSQVYDI
jgi:hypothetical protein